MKIYESSKNRESRQLGGKKNANGYLTVASDQGDGGVWTTIYDTPAIGMTRSIYTKNGKELTEEVSTTTKETFWKYAVSKDSFGKIDVLTIDDPSGQFWITFDTTQRSVKLQKIVKSGADSYAPGGPTLILYNNNVGIFTDYEIK